MERDELTSTEKGRSHCCPGSCFTLSKSKSKRMRTPSLAAISGHRALQNTPKGPVPQKLIGFMDSHNTAMSWYIPVFLSFYCQIIFHYVLLLPSPNNGHWDCLHDYDIAFSPWTSILIQFRTMWNIMKSNQQITTLAAAFHIRWEMCVFPEAMTLQALYMQNWDCITWPCFLWVYRKFSEIFFIIC